MLFTVFKTRIKNRYIMFIVKVLTFIILFFCSYVHLRFLADRIKIILSSTVPVAYIYLLQFDKKIKIQKMSA